MGKFTANSEGSNLFAIRREQDLINYMDVKDYKNALLLALSMNQPRRLYSLLSEIFSDTSTSKFSQSSDVLSQVLGSLTSHDVFRLLEYVRDWNAKSRDSDIAQSVLHMLLKTQSVKQILNAAPAQTGLEFDSTVTASTSPSIGDIIEALIPYTERHYARAARLEQESAFLDFVLAQMDEYAIKIDGVAQESGYVALAGATNGFVIDDMPIAGR